MLSLWVSMEYKWSASLPTTPSHATMTTTSQAVEQWCPGRCFTTTSSFSSRLARRITHLAKGHPLVVLPSLPVYKIYNILSLCTRHTTILRTTALKNKNSRYFQIKPQLTKIKTNFLHQLFSLNSLILQLGFCLWVYL